MAIVATTQQSRFHAETLQTDCEDVDLKQLNLTVDGEELLKDAVLRLFAGVHYGLVGANGVGKSTLLKAIGSGQVVGFPTNIFALYVDQLSSKGANSLISQVMDADKDVVTWRRQAQLLQDRLGDPDAVNLVGAVKDIKIADLQAEVVAAGLINDLRSGARGKEAQNHLLELEAKLQAAEASRQRAPTAKEIQAAPAIGQELLENLLQNLSFAEADTAEARARRILLGLGFSKSALDKPVSELSGGWQMRAALAQALFLEPDILLLDEPTNFLDLPSILWFQRYLNSLEDKTIVIVSHDRAFLDATTKHIILFRDKKLTYHTGNYSEYRQAADDKRQHSLRLQEGIDKKKSRMEKSIQENLASAKKAGDDKKLKQVASKQRKLEERVGVEKNEKGHRFRLQKDMGDYFTTTRRDVVIEQLDSTPAWKFPEPAPVRTKGPLVQMDSVTFSYPNTGGSGSTPAASKPKVRLKPILKDITLCLEQGSRTAFVGANGKGKSTLVKLVLGELQPVAGDVSRHPQGRTGVFTQHSVERLVIDKGEESALSHLKDHFPDAKEQDLRKQLGSFGIKGGLATQKLATLSGGQAVRVQLACIAYAAPHLLVLDEPSSHLDMLSIDALTTCLSSFGGGVLLVSHDQHLVTSIADQVYLVDDGTIRLLENGVKDYVKELQKKQRQPG